MVKKHIHILLALITVLCVVLTGCEVIGQDSQLIYLDTITAQDIPAENTKRHLLIDYTGVNCVNCPRAAETAHELQTIYPNLIVVAMHPASNPFTKAAAKYDYTCPEADTYYKFMGGLPTTPFPTGNLDFTATDNNYLTDNSTWATAVHAVQKDTALVRMSVITQWQDQKLQVQYTLRLMEEQERAVDILLWIIENNIIGAQNMPDGTLNMNYTHQHMLRTSLNGEWGDAVTLHPGEDTPHKALYSLSDKWVLNNCQLVVVVLDHNNHQLLNAHEVAIPNK